MSKAACIIAEDNLMTPPSLLLSVAAASVLRAVAWRVVCCTVGRLDCRNIEITTSYFSGLVFPDDKNK